MPSYEGMEVVPPGGQCVLVHRVLAGALQRGTISVDKDAERQVKHILPLLLAAFLYK